MKKILVVALCALSMTIFTAFTSTTPEVNTTISTNAPDTIGDIMVSWDIVGGPAYLIISGHRTWSSSGSMWVMHIDEYSITAVAGFGYRVTSILYTEEVNGVSVVAIVKPVDE